jgi:hypothetical protein
VPDHVPPSHRERIISIPFNQFDTHRDCILDILDNFANQSDGGFIYIKHLDAIERIRPLKRSFPDDSIDCTPPSPSLSSSPTPPPSETQDENPSLIVRQLKKRKRVHIDY